MRDYSEDELATIEDCDIAAREALVRPSDAAFWDDRLYTSHVPVLSWADRSDDVLSESNFHTVLAELQDFDRGLEDVDYAGDAADVFEASVSHWAVGSLRQIWVRVYVAGSEEYTVAFRRAVSIALYLRDDYPVFDDDDLSTREFEAHEETLELALHDAQNGHDDTPEVESAATDKFYELMQTGELRDDYYPDVSWPAVADLYARARAEVQA